MATSQIKKTGYEAAPMEFPPPSSTSAAARLLALPELLEMILLLLAPPLPLSEVWHEACSWGKTLPKGTKPLFRLHAISRDVEATLTGSLKLQQAMLMAQGTPSAALPKDAQPKWYPDVNVSVDFLTVNWLLAHACLVKQRDLWRGESGVFEIQLTTLFWHEGRKQIIGMNQCVFDERAKAEGEASWRRMRVSWREGAERRVRVVWPVKFRYVEEKVMLEGEFGGEERLGAVWNWIKGVLECERKAELGALGGEGIPCE